MSILEVEGASLFYQVKGEGIPILFVHPPYLTSTTFDKQVEDLSSHYQVITFDIRGHGYSTPSTLPLTYERIRTDMVHLLDALTIDKCYACGYSLGGTIVLDFLLNAKERVEGGILIGGVPEVRDSLLRTKIKMAALLMKSKGRQLLAKSLAKSHARTTEQYKMLLHTSLQGDPLAIAQYYQYSLHYSCTSLLPEIKHPVHLTYGEEDKQFHKYAHLLSQNLPNNQLHFIKEADHRIPTKHPKALWELIQNFILT
ncbi:hypothetical protein Q73_01745 [Bacillus coahuilensis m2-6]|uniref:alpha/beta fold hydrolase n=1 Tax=Bacillus coahuilensis TaxID=408580 RepID=UPI00075011A5|nr:alpha/beta hydrolase [Bacillus coahuilensis]KUP09713.1 hypothetical protein Q73_01745 [Bacillus coahuilensis m2-6]